MSVIDRLIVIIGQKTSLIPSRWYLSSLSNLLQGHKIDWKNPKTFNDKLSWLKVYNRKDIYTKMVDKYEAKSLVEKKIGKEYVVNNYGVYNKWEGIKWDELPNQFVIKCTHDSGGAYICRDKKTFNYERVKADIEKNLKENHWLGGREWPYKNVKARILIDELLDEHTGRELNDYKFWCFNGEPKYMYCTVKAKEIYENFYDMDFNPVLINHGFPRHKPEFEKPAVFDEMKKLAAKLSAGIPFVRVDFFYVDGKIYFGEFTFYDWGGVKPFEDDWDKKLGKLIDLNNLIIQ